MAPVSHFYPPGTELAGKYRVERLLGQGGMGAVYLAVHVGIGRKVAIKVLLPQFAYDTELLARFRNEARAASAIHHAGIVEMLDVGTGPEGEPFLVMELLEGESLGARLRRTGALELDVAAWIALQLLDAVGAAHEKGIVHRDLKPDNVFLVVSPRTAVKVLDFGISKFHLDEEPSLTSTRTVLGTPAYMAPEQARSARAAGPPADLYAVGGILYEVLTGAPPFVGQSYNEVVAKLLTEPHRSLALARPDLPASLAKLVDDLLAKAPEDRPANTAEVMVRLRAALASAVATPDLRSGLTAAPTDLFSATIPKGSSSPPAQGAPTTEPDPKRPRRGRLVAGLALGAVVLGVGIGALVQRGGSAAVAVASNLAALDASSADASAPEQEDASAPDAGPEPSDAAAPGPDASRAHRPRIATPVRTPPLPKPPPVVAAPGPGPARPDAGRARAPMDIDQDNVFLPGGAGRR